MHLAFKKSQTNWWFCRLKFIELFWCGGERQIEAQTKHFVLHFVAQTNYLAHDAGGEFYWKYFRKLSGANM